MGPGTLYSSIQALLEDGLIEEVDRSSKPADTHGRCGTLIVSG
jgi:DNA-binding PadR family transcriptional regulator